MRFGLTKILASAAAIGALALPLAATAAVPGESQLHGTITARDGKFDIHVQERNGNVDDVMLHDGTIINPIGLTLRPGMRITIVGNASGDVFHANEIDTPYHIEYAVPAPGFYGGSYWGGPFWGSRFGWF